MTQPVLYGIKNCDTVRKARKWLDSEAIEYRFHDFREDALELSKINDWLEQVGSDTLLNRKSTTWRQLSDQQKQQAESSQLATLLRDHPTLIKRPVLEYQDKINTGFSADTYQQLLAK